MLFETDDPGYSLFSWDSSTEQFTINQYNTDLLPLQGEAEEKNYTVTFTYQFSYDSSVNFPYTYTGSSPATNVATFTITVKNPCLDESVTTITPVAQTDPASD